MTQTSSTLEPQQPANDVLGYGSQEPLLLAVKDRFLADRELHDWEIDALDCCAAAYMARWLSPILIGLSALMFVIGSLVFLMMFLTGRYGGVERAVLGYSAFSCAAGILGFGASIVSVVRGGFVWSMLATIVVVGWLLVSLGISIYAEASSIVIFLLGLCAIEAVPILLFVRHTKMRQRSFTSPMPVWVNARKWFKDILYARVDGWLDCPQLSIQTRPPHIPRLRFFDNGVVLLKNVRAKSLYISGDDARRTPVQRDATNAAYVIGWSNRGRAVKDRVWLTDEVARAWEVWVNEASSEVSSASTASTDQAAAEQFEPLKLDFQYTQADYASAVRLIRPRGTWRSILVLIIVAILLGGPALYAPLPLIIVDAVVWTIIVIALVAEIRRGSAGAWKRMPWMMRPKSAILSADDISIRDALTRSDYRWEAFIGFRENAELFVLMYSKTRFEMIPKRALPNGADADRIRALLTRVISRRAVVLGER